MDGTSPSFSSLGTGGDASGESVSTGASDISARIGYGLGERSRLHLTLLKSDLSGGFGDTNKFDAALGYEHRISPTLNLDFSYRFVKSDGTASYGGMSDAAAQSYSANVLSLTLNARFAGGARPRPTAAGYRSTYSGGRLGRYDSALNSTFGGYRTGRPSQYGQGYGGMQPHTGYGSGGAGFGGYSSPGASYGGYGSYGRF
jgi:hypothetical protein